MKFIGVDLGWLSGASGLCCLAWQNNQLEIIELTTVLELNCILAWIDRHLPKNTTGLVAIDAPTIITNQTGMRLCDKLTHKHFGRYHAGCYPANLGLKFAPRTTGFSQNLVDRSFAHAPTVEPQKPGRYQIEVFPHPATINLFELDKILKYKKGRIADRRSELIKLRRYIIDVLPNLEPKLSLSSIDNIPAIAIKQTGKELKAIEDRLDSLICAYVAAHWWYWGEKRNMVLGNLTEGFIVVPQPKKSEIS